MKRYVTPEWLAKENSKNLFGIASWQMMELP
jgi:hypothetical protein